MIFATVSPPCWKGFLRQVTGQVAASRLDLRGQPWQVRLAQAFSSCCSALFLWGRLVPLVWEPFLALYSCQPPIPGIGEHFDANMLQTGLSPSSDK
jgi:hypothetical protein